MERPYSQFRAMMAIVKASFAAQLKSPSALVFGFAFPLFFILIFGSSRTGVPTVNIAFHPQSDTSSANIINTTLRNIKANLNIVTKDSATLWEDLEKGRITAILNIQPNLADSFTRYKINIHSSKASQQNMGLLQSILTSIIKGMDDAAAIKSGRPVFTLAKTNSLPPTGDRIYRRIDYVLPGQLGFSLLSAGLFGVSFLFFNLRETLVLKRLNATPIRRSYIILGEAIARIAFQLIITALIIILGKYMFNFTLVKGVQTFFELLVLSTIGLLVFMAFGFVISGVAKSINTIPVITNLLGFPQFMLSGTFFPYEGLPKFLHPISKSLPLTHLNDALRKISFEGLTLRSCLPEIGIMCIWMVVLYAIAFKVFKWE
jgi:ABC-2 type transport system permease protein